jgi:uncharacterized protein YkwD
MSRTRTLLAVVLALALAPAAHGNPVLDEVNQARARHGLAALRASESLERSASAFARHLMRSQRFAHGRRIRASRRFRTLGEALALRVGPRPLRHATTVRSWLRSPGHRALLLSRSFRYAGAGWTRGRFGGRPAAIWVLHLGSL